MSLADIAARGAAKIISAQLIRIVIQLASVVILSRLLDPSDFGLVAMVTAIAGVAFVLGDFGLSAATIQAKVITHKERSNLFWTNVAIGLALTLAVFFLAAPLAAFYNDARIAPITQAISVTYLLNAVSGQFRAQLSRDLRFGWLAFADILAPAVALVVATAAALSGIGVWSLVMQSIVLAAVTLVVLVSSARWLPGLPGRTPMRKLYAFGAGVLGIRLVTYVSSSVDKIIVGRSFGSTSTGYYSRAYQLFQLPAQQVAGPAGIVLFPILSKLQDDPPRYEAYALRAQLLFAYCVGGMFFILATCADPIIDIALGPSWGPAKPVFLVLALGGVFQALTYNYSFIFQTKGLVGYQLRFSLIGRSAMVLLLFAGIPFGIVGVACAATMGQAVMWVLYTIIASPRAGLSPRKLVDLAVAPYFMFTVASAVGLLVSRLTDTFVAPAQLVLTLAAFAAVVAGASLSVPKLQDNARIVTGTVMRAVRSSS